MEKLIKKIKSLASQIDISKYDSIFGIAKNGLIVALLLEKELGIPVVYDITDITDNTLIVDDIIDSGKTLGEYPFNDWAVIYRKPESPKTTYFVEETTGWISIPFEKDKDIQDSILRMIQFTGDDSTREGLRGTPERVARMYGEIFGGYKQRVEDLFKAQFNCDNDQMVIVKDIEYYSHCEHHIVPFFGKVHIGYIPNGKVLGLSKFGRLVDVFSRRLQIQEQMTFQIADAIIKHLKPKGLIVIVEGVHLCMAMRGVKKINSSTITSEVRGLMKDNDVARNEFLSLIKK